LFFSSKFVFLLNEAEKIIIKVIILNILVDYTSKLTSWKIILLVSSLLDSINGVGLDINGLFENVELFKASFLLHTLVSHSFATLLS